MRLIARLFLCSASVLIVACGKGPAGQDVSKAGLEEKMVRFLDKHAPELDPYANLERKHKSDPQIERGSETWEIKKVEDAPWDRVRPKRNQLVTVQGLVTSYGGTTPEVAKHVRLALHYQGFDFKFDKMGTRTMTLPEAQVFLKAIDAGIKAQNQVSLGGAVFVSFSQDLGHGLGITGNIHKQTEWEKKAPEFTLALRVGEPAIDLKPSDWMELKLKVEAAIKWLETQNGDASGLPQDPAAAGKK